MRRAFALPLACLVVLPAPARPPSRLQQTREVQEAARAFFRWYDEHWKDVGETLTASYKTDPAEPFGIDFQKLKVFLRLLHTSGHVDEELIPKVERLYRKRDASVRDMPPEERQETGDSFLMEWDTDPIYFSQETGLAEEGEPPFSTRLTFDRVRIRGDRATLRVVSPFGWTEDIALVRRDGRWKLSALGQYR